MRNLTIYTSFLLTLTLATGCTGFESKRHEMATLEVEKYFDIDSIDNLSNKIRIVNVCQPEFTDSSMLSDFVIGGIINNRMFLKSVGYNREKSWIYTFDYPSGRLVDAFNRYGAGPEEFTYGSNGAFRAAGVGQWVVLDEPFLVDRLLEYNSTGEFLRSLKNDSIENIAATTAGWVSYNQMFSLEGKPHIVREKKLYLYNAQFEAEGTIELKSRRWEPMSTQLTNDLIPLQGEIYINDLDTIYRIDPVEKTLDPTIAINLGKYSYDWGSIETMEELRSVGDEHINPFIPVFNTQYAFISYMYGRYNDGGVCRFDVYDMNDGSLVYRRAIPYDANVSLTAGFPLEIDGTTYMGWPIEYTNSENFYFLIEADQVAEVAGTDDVNPIIVEVEIK